MTFWNWSQRLLDQFQMAHHLIYAERVYAERAGSLRPSSMRSDLMRQTAPHICQWFLIMDQKRCLAITKISSITVVSIDRIYLRAIKW